MTPVVLKHSRPFSAEMDQRYQKAWRAAKPSFEKAAELLEGFVDSDGKSLAQELFQWFQDIIFIIFVEMGSCVDFSSACEKIQ